MKHANSNRNCRQQNIYWINNIRGVRHIFGVLAVLVSLAVQADSDIQEIDSIRIYGRLFDSPQQPTIATETGKNKTDAMSADIENVLPQTHIEFNGVLSHGVATQAWINNRPLTTTEKVTGARKIQFNPITDALEVTLINGNTRQLKLGESITIYSDGSFRKYPIRK